MIIYEVEIKQFELLILVMMRIASFLYVAPIFNTANTPRRIKVGLAFFISLLICSINKELNVEYSGAIEYTLLVVKEVVLGIILGLSASFCVQIIMFSGKIIDMDTGLSMAQIMDPTTKIQVGIFGNFYYYMLLMLLIISGLHRYLISAIIETYNVIPIGGIVLNDNVFEEAISFMGRYFVLGFRIALPVFSATILLNVILGILARIAPQMNMFVVGMQLKIFVGIFVILFTITLLPSISNMIENEIRTVMATLVRGMTP